MKKISIDTVLIRKIMEDSAAAMADVPLKIIPGTPAVECSDRGVTMYIPIPINKQGMVEVRGYIDHECSHLLHSPPSGRGLDAVEKLVENVLEDIRTDECMATKYKGCKTNIEQMVDRTCQTAANSIVSELLRGLYHNSKVLETHNTEATKISDEVEPMMQEWRDCDPADMHTRRDIVRRVGRVLKLRQDQKDRNPRKSQPGKSEKDKLCDKACADQQQPGAGESANPVKNGCENSMKNGAEKINNAVNHDANILNTDSADDETDMGKMMRNEAMTINPNVDEGLANAVQHVSKSCRELDKQMITNNPQSNLQQSGDFLQAYNEGRKKAHRIKRLLETDVPKPAEPAKRGRRIDRRSLARWVTKTTDKVLLTHAPRKGLSVAIALSLDASGSMSSHARQVARGACELSGALISMGIPHEISNFSSGNGALLEVIKSFEQPFLSGMEAKSSGGTPLASGIMFSASRLIQRKEKRKILFVLTDGQGNSVYSRSLRRRSDGGFQDGSGCAFAVDLCRQHGIEVYAFDLAHSCRFWMEEKYIQRVQRHDVAGAFIQKAEQLLLRSVI